MPKHNTSSSQQTCPSARRFAGLLLSVLLSLFPLAQAADCGGNGNGNPGGGVGGGTGGTSSNCGAPAPAAQNSSAPSSGAGNPINLLNGNKYQHETDLAPLPGVLGLELTRHYNSSSRYIGQTGMSWRTSYEAILYTYPTTLQILQADGRRIIFPRDNRTPERAFGLQPENGRIDIKDHVYRWVWPDGRVLTFRDGRGGAYPLNSIQAATGETVTLRYDPNGNLLSVTDPQGRSLQYIYGRPTPGSRTLILSAIDTPVGRFSYNQDTLRRLIGVAYPPDQNQQVGRRYHYEDARNPYALTGFSLEVRNKTDSQPKFTRLSTFRYDAAGRGMGSEQAGGVNKISLSYPKPGVTLLTNSLGAKSEYHSERVAGDERLTAAIGPGCATCPAPNRRYGYNNQGQVIEESKLSDQDQPLQTIRTERDALGRVIKVSRITFKNGKPQIAQMIVRYEYSNDSTQPTLIARPSVIPGKEQQTKIDYNTAGQIIKVTESGYSPALDKAPATAIERSTTYGYSTINGRSLLTQIDGPLPNGKSNSPADSDITQLKYDGRGNYLKEVVYPMNLTQKLEYNEAGRLQKITGIDGLVTQTSYDPLGHLQTSTHAGLTTTYKYNARGDLAHVSRSSGEHLTFKFDAAGRPIKALDHLGRSTSITRDNEGQLLEQFVQADTAATSPKLLRHAVTYDPSGLIRETTDPLNYVTRIKADPNARTLTITDPLQRYSVMLLTSDDHRSVIDFTTASQSQTSATTQINVTANGAQSTVVAANAAQTQYLADDFGRTIQVTSADTGVTRNSYSAADQLLQTTDAAGRATRYSYDPLGRITERVQQANTTTVLTPTITTRYKYQAARLIQIDHPNQQTAYGYDAAGRVNFIRRSIAGHAYITKTCFGSSCESGTSTAQQALNGADPLYGLPTQQILADSSMLRVQYNNKRQATHIIWMDALGTEHQLLADAKHHPVFGLSGYTLGNGIGLNLQFDNAGRTTQFAYSAPGTADAKTNKVASVNMTNIFDRINPIRAAQAVPAKAGPFASLLPNANLVYDPVGRIRSITRNNTEQSFDYDAHDRLIAERKATTERTYNYDLVGNRIDTTQTASNRLQGVEYDASGRPLSIPQGQRTLSYDAAGRISQVQIASPNAQSPAKAPLTARYAYNENGARISKTVDQHTTHFLYDGPNLAAEMDAQGNITAQYVWMGHIPLAKLTYAAPVAPRSEQVGWFKRNAAKAAIVLGLSQALVPQSIQAAIDTQAHIGYIHSDHRGAPQLVTDQNAQAIWQADTAAYGQTKILNAGLIANRVSAASAASKGYAIYVLQLRLPGQYEDSETGWHYNIQRTYDPATGRYLESDPLGLRAGINTYGYANGDPVRFVDPWGLDAVSANGITTFNTAFADLQTFTIPTLPGWQDYINNSLLGHRYNKRVSVSGLNRSELENLSTYIIDNPTPNSGTFPATFDGTYNPASPDYGPFAGSVANFFAPDDVVSYLRTGLSGRTYVVNVTTQNHSLKFGIVIRGVHCENGKAIFDNYGEGSGVLQSIPYANNYFINDIWYWATEDALEKVTGRKYSVNGRDWNLNN